MSEGVCDACGFEVSERLEMNGGQLCADCVQEHECARDHATSKRSCIGGYPVAQTVQADDETEVEIWHI